MSLVFGWLAVLVVAGVVGQWWLDRRTRQRYPCPGQLIPVARHRLHFDCQGEGDFTVVLEAGAGAFSSSWQPVREGLLEAGGLRVCSYDRTGLGWSDPAPGDHTINGQIDALHQGLERLGITSKIILVGHSYGGLLVSAYAHRYAGQVAGVVLVEPNTVLYFDRCPEQMVMARRLGTVLAAVAPLGWVRWLAAARGVSAIDLLDRAAARRLLALSLTTRHLRAQAQMMRAFPDTIESMRHRPLPMDIPLTLISRGRDDPGWAKGQREIHWRDAHRQLIQGRPNATLVVARQSDHMVPWRQPRLVVDSIICLRDKGES